LRSRRQRQGCDRVVLIQHHQPVFPVIHLSFGLVVVCWLDEHPVEPLEHCALELFVVQLDGSEEGPGGRRRIVLLELQPELAEQHQRLRGQRLDLEPLVLELVQPFQLVLNSGPAEVRVDDEVRRAMPGKPLRGSPQRLFLF
jgi:hypothetical protein